MLKNRLKITTMLLLLLASNSYADVIDYITDEHPNSRYSVHNNGTVTDNQTGLMWKVCSQQRNWGNTTPVECTSSGEKSVYNWKEALAQAANARFAGYSDWRLPNMQELGSIVAYNRYRPSINEVIFPNTIASNPFWSSSPSTFVNSARLISFFHGKDITNLRTVNYRVRLVRLGE